MRLSSATRRLLLRATIAVSLASVTVSASAFLPISPLLPSATNQHPKSPSAPSCSSSTAPQIPPSPPASASSGPSSLVCGSTSSGTSNEQTMSKQSGMPRWYQHEISIMAPSRGCHLITDKVTGAIKSDLSSRKIGMANLFIQHTSASLTINENADPDVRRDMEMALNKIVPASWNHDGTFRHTMEGDDDMPGHVKSSLMGPSLNIPIRNGQLALGTWQGIYLNEHRDQGGWGGGHNRRIIITLQGQA